MLNIIDQSSDKSLATLRKFASLLTDEDLGEYVWELGNSVTTQTKTASETKFASPVNSKFPVGSKEDTVLSKVYFEGQREKIAAESPVLASEIASRLDTYMDLYGVPEVFQMQKEASQAKTDFRPRYLMPSSGMFKVATITELNSAAKSFEKGMSGFSVPERIEFSKEFSKLATTIKDQSIPKFIHKYCGVMESDINNVVAMLQLRKTAAKRIGKDGVEYEKLASVLNNVEKPNATELEKLADTIYTIDRKYGFASGKMAKAVPDAYAIVFNKEAEVEDVDSDEDFEFASVKKYTKADIITNFGEAALEGLENPDGTIDYNKLKVLIDSSPIKESEK